MRVRVLLLAVVCASALFSPRSAAEDAPEGRAAVTKERAAKTERKRQLDGLADFVAKIVVIDVDVAYEQGDTTDKDGPRTRTGASGRTPDASVPSPAAARPQVELPTDPSPLRAVEVPGPQGTSGRAVERIVPPAMRERFVARDVRVLGQMREIVAAAARARVVKPALARDLDVQLQHLRRSWDRQADARSLRTLSMQPVDLRRARAVIQGATATFGVGRDAATVLAAEAAARFDGARRERPDIAFAPGDVGVPPRASAPVLQALPPRVQLPAGLRGRTAGVGTRVPSPPIARPGGVKIAIEADTLRQALDWSRHGAEMREMVALEDALVGSRDRVDARARLEAYLDRKKADYLARARKLSDRGQARFVRLQPLLDQAHAHAGRWAERPTSLWTVGGLTRIYGFVRDPKTHGLILVGTQEPWAPAIRFDDLTVGLRSVWQDGLVPTCSLDPREGDAEHRQWSMVDGVPGDSPFALAMLEADYVMKRLMFGVLPTKATKLTYPEYPLEREALPPPSRTWFYPRQPAPQSIEVGPGGSSALFTARAQVLAEDLATLERGDRPDGHVHPIAKAKAEALTRQLPLVAREQPDLARLQSLFDIVTLALVLRELAPADPQLHTLCKLPYASKEVPAWYAQVTHDTDMGTWTHRIQGGCDIGIRLHGGSLIEARTPSRDALELAAAAGRRLRLRVPVAAARVPEADRWAQVAARAIARGDAPAAERALGAAIRLDPTWLEAWVRRAKTRLLQERYVDAAWDAARAVQLAPGCTMLRRFFRHVIASAQMKEVVEDAGVTDDSVLASLLENGARALEMSEGGTKGDMLQAAAEQFDAALELGPDDARALAGRIVAAIGLGDTRTARRRLDQVRERLPDDEVLLWRLVRASAALEDTAATLEITAHALRVLPTTDAHERAELYMVRAHVLRTDRPREAVEAMSRALSLAPDVQAYHLLRPETVRRQLESDAGLEPRRKRALVALALEDLDRWLEIESEKPLDFGAEAVARRDRVRSLQLYFKEQQRVLQR